jgi:hypothetical protein
LRTVFCIISFHRIYKNATVTNKPTPTFLFVVSQICALEMNYHQFQTHQGITKLPTHVPLSIGIRKNFFSIEDKKFAVSLIGNFCYDLQIFVSKNFFLTLIIVLL